VGTMGTSIGYVLIYIGANNDRARYKEGYNRRFDIDLIVTIRSTTIWFELPTTSIGTTVQVHLNLSVANTNTNNYFCRICLDKENPNSKWLAVSLWPRKWH
jgi:hypothetical protein